MEFKQGQMIVILSPFSDVEIYGNITNIRPGALALTVKTAGLLKEGWDISCLVFDDADIYEFYSRVMAVDGVRVIIEEPLIEGLSTIEKRRFSRVDCNIGFVARLMFINDISVEKMSKTFIGRIKNISAGGMLAETNLCLPKDTIFTFKLKLSYFIDCIVKIRRVSEIPQAKMYEMGCEFINMKVENIKSISMFTFKEQLKKKRIELHDNIYK